MATRSSLTEPRVKSNLYNSAFGTKIEDVSKKSAKDQLSMQQVKLGAHEEHVAVLVGVFAEPGFPAPSFSVYEERMHARVGLLGPMERVA
jgi:hypothetical protein